MTPSGLCVPMPDFGFFPFFLRFGFVKDPLRFPFLVDSGMMPRCIPLACLPPLAVGSTMPL